MNMNSCFALPAFKYRNYRLFFSGQSISLIGTWMQQVAMSWLVYRLTNSVLLLGIVGFSSQIPALFLTPLAGILADRHNRRRMLIITQTLAMIQAVILSVLVLTGNIEIWHIIILGVFLGIVNAFDIPIRQAFTVDMIEKKEDLGNAIALNSSMFNLARLIGPSIAGLLIALSGEGICFILNSFSFLTVIISLLSMKIIPKENHSQRNHILQELKEGIDYAFNFRPIRYILILLAVISLIGVPYQVLMPVFAKDILHGGPQTFGYLVAMAGSGALIGTIYLALRKSIAGLGRVIAITTGIFGTGIIFFSFSKTLLFSMIVALICGFGMMVQMASCNTIIQTVVDEDKRGRVMSFYTLSLMGTVPFGNLLAGSMAAKFGPPFTLLIGGIFCVIGALIFAQKFSLKM